jgi:hypothetical protein
MGIIWYAEASKNYRKYISGKNCCDTKIDESQIILKVTHFAIWPIVNDNVLIASSASCLPRDNRIIIINETPINSLARIKGCRIGWRDPSKGMSFGWGLYISPSLPARFMKIVTRNSNRARCFTRRSTSLEDMAS